MSQVLTYVQKNWPNHVTDVKLKPYWQHRTELSTHDVYLLWGHYVIVPPQGRTVVLPELHGGDLGVTWIESLVHVVLSWPKVDDEIAF